jgi:hypothetical protein
MRMILTWLSHFTQKTNNHSCSSLDFAPAVSAPLPPTCPTPPPRTTYSFVSPTDTPLYGLTHYSSKPAQSTGSSISSNLPSRSTSAFAGTLTALSGASSATQVHHTGGGGGVRVGGGGWAGQTRYPDDCERELGYHRGGDEGERDVPQVGGQVLRVDRVRVHHCRQSVAFGRLSFSFLQHTDMKFVILHETKNNDGIKVFFNDGEAAPHRFLPQRSFSKKCPR